MNSWFCSLYHWELQVKDPIATLRKSKIKPTKLLVMCKPFQNQILFKFQLK